MKVWLWIIYATQRAIKPQVEQLQEIPQKIKDIIFCLVGTQVQVGDVFDESFSDDKEMSVSKGPFRSGLRFTFLFIERASW